MPGSRLCHEGDGEWSNYGCVRTTAIGDCGTLTVDASSYGVQGAKEAWIDRNGERVQVTTEGEEISPVKAFVVTVLDGEQTVALIQSAYWLADEGRIMMLGAFEKSVYDRR